MIEFSNKHGDFQARTKSTFTTFVLYGVKKSRQNKEFFLAQWKRYSPENLKRIFKIEENE